MRITKACDRTYSSKHMHHMPGVDYMSPEILALIRKRNTARKKAQTKKSLATVQEFKLRRER